MYDEYTRTMPLYVPPATQRADVWGYPAQQWRMGVTTPLGANVAGFHSPIVPVAAPVAPKTKGWTNSALQRAGGLRVADYGSMYANAQAPWPPLPRISAIGRGR